MGKLYQPFMVKHPAVDHRGVVITLQDFINRLKEEEDYWEGEQHNTKLIISHLRKIFYDEWGWDELIPGAKKVANRYLVQIINEPEEGARPLRRDRSMRKNKETRKKNLEKNKNDTKNNNDNNGVYQPRYRKVIYRDNDRVYGATRAGQSPFIFTADHREVLLPSGYYCDMAHLLAGTDAFNNPAVVGPLPFGLNALKIGPHVNFNGDITTWLGDMASYAADFFFAYTQATPPTPLTDEQMQEKINTDAPGSKMLSDVDTFVIATKYDIGSGNGMRFTDILTHYYYGTAGNPPFRNYRCRYYCEAVHLKGWNGTSFENEDEWRTNYYPQLRDNICFQIYSLIDVSLPNLWLLVRIWFNAYKDVLKIDLLLDNWLSALKEELKKELI